MLFCVLKGLKARENLDYSKTTIFLNICNYFKRRLISILDARTSPFRSQPEWTDTSRGGNFSLCDAKESKRNIPPPRNSSSHLEALQKRCKKLQLEHSQ